MNCLVGLIVAMWRQWKVLSGWGCVRVANELLRILGPRVHQLLEVAEAVQEALTGGRLGAWFVSQQGGKQREGLGQEIQTVAETSDPRPRLRLRLMHQGQGSSTNTPTAAPATDLIELHCMGHRVVGVLRAKQARPRSWERAGREQCSQRLSSAVDHPQGSASSGQCNQNVRWTW